MTDVDIIRRAYSETQKHYMKAIDLASSRNDADYSVILEMSRVNDYAYFIIFWGQFEAFVNEKAREIDGDYSRDVGFMPRLQLCMSPNHPYYKDLDEYYYWRCELAHGRIAQFPDLIPPFIFDKIEEIAEAIRASSLPLGDPFDDYF